MSTTNLPTPAVVGARAAEILGGMQAHPGYDQLVGSSMKYSSCWATFSGYTTISEWSLARDAGPLLTEALRVMALKAATYELTGGDAEASELLVSAAIDEMIHAVLAQHTVVLGIETALGVHFPHATELERFTYERGGFTDLAYAAAGWGEQPTRYWIGTAEVNRRLAILNTHYQRAGFGRDGRSHGFDFESAPGEMVAAG